MTLAWASEHAYPCAMGFFDKLKSAVGVGSPKLELDVNPATFSSGSKLAGTVLVTMQDRETPIKTITIKLVRDIESTMADGSKIKRQEVNGECVLPMSEVKLAANQSARFPFALEAGATEASLGTVFELHAIADAPGLDPKTAMTLTLVEAPSMPTSGVEAFSPAGLFPIYPTFVTELSEAFSADEIVWIPQYAEAAYEPGRLFEKGEIVPELLAELRGRVVFLAGEFGNNFGVLVPIDGGVTIVSIVDGMRGASGCPIEFMNSLSISSIRRTSRSARSTLLRLRTRSKHCSARPARGDLARRACLAPSAGDTAARW